MITSSLIELMIVFQSAQEITGFHVQRLRQMILNVCLSCSFVMVLLTVPRVLMSLQTVLKV